MNGFEPAALHVRCWREAYAAYLPADLMATFSTEKRLPMWQAALVNPERFILGAYVDDVPVGFVMSGAPSEKYIDDQDGHLWALYIAASQHRKGIGRALAFAAVQHWLEKGGKTMTIGVLRENTPARAFYENLGAKLLKYSTYNWGGFDLPDCLYIFYLAKIAKF
ncbi:MAG: GNAT family N-acetyltransferase [Pseudomonadota bacterium]|nr:GNAT family N-acetyltransferase [Pseudomonadota bacterium]